MVSPKVPSGFVQLGVKPSESGHSNASTPTWAFRWFSPQSDWFRSLSRPVQPENGAPSEIFAGARPARPYRGRGSQTDEPDRKNWRAEPAPSARSSQRSAHQVRRAPLVPIMICPGALLGEYAPDIPRILHAALGSFRGTLTTQLYSSRTRNKAVVKLGVRNAFLTITWALTMQMLNDDLA